MGKNLPADKVSYLSFLSLQLPQRLHGPLDFISD